MTVQDVLDLLGAKDMTPDAPKDLPVTSGYACDLLSWVMAHGKAHMAWITVQTHMNVIAVASLMEMSLVIIPEGIDFEAASLAKAKEEGINVLQSDKTAYEICALLAAAGLPGQPQNA